MMKKVYLVWHSFVMNQLFTIGTLTEVNDKHYIFKYDVDALDAAQEGCFLPFRYTTEEIHFSGLPVFFDQRMLKGQFNIKTFGIDYSAQKEMDLLTFGDGVKNSDNFRVVSEPTYLVLKEELIDPKRKKQVPNKKH